MISITTLFVVTAFFGTPISSEFFFTCVGNECPAFSLPERRSDSGVNCNSSDISGIFKDPQDCHSYFVCSDNGTAVKVECRDGYGFHEEWKACVPENMIRNCSSVYCPGYIFDGVIPDPKDCRNYYRCSYGYPVDKSRCPKYSVFDAQSGRCKRYPPEQKPACLIKPVVKPPTTTTTSIPTPTTVIPITSSASTSFPIISFTTEVSSSSTVPSHEENSTFPPTN